MKSVLFICETARRVASHNAHCPDMSFPREARNSKPGCSRMGLRGALNIKLSRWLNIPCCYCQRYIRESRTTIRQRRLFTQRSWHLLSQSDSKMRVARIICPKPTSTIAHMPVSAIHK
jgi:hypothetical protein